MIKDQDLVVKNKNNLMNYGVFTRVNPKGGFNQS